MDRSPSAACGCSKRSQRDVRMDLGVQLEFPRLQHIAIDASVVAYIVGTSIFTGVLLGLAPAIRHSSPAPHMTALLRAPPIAHYLASAFFAAGAREPAGRRDRARHDAVRRRRAPSLRVRQAVEGGPRFQSSQRPDVPGGRARGALSPPASEDVR